MSVFYQDAHVTLHHGDCLDVLATLPDASVDAVVTDPPYGIRFMGRSWDGADIESATATRRAQAAMPDDGRSGANGGYRSASTEAGRYDLSANAAFGHWCEQWARECLRILKPGGHMLAFGGPRTWHRLASAVEDAGFGIRDSIAWLYGSGFPKSHNLTGDWQGWGTALKPAFEPVVCARKPFNAVPLGEEANRLHHLIGGLLWLSLSPAKRAELTSPSSPAGQHGATCVSALVSAALDTSPGASDQTATFNSPALASTSSNIASSWSATLGALSARTRTSTTSTASSTTTALRTLNSLLGPITSQTTMPKCGCLLGGPSSPAPSVASSSSDEWARWLHTLSASVPATATEGIALAVASALAQVAGELSDAQAEASSAAPTATTGAAASRSAFEPIVVGRKPLAGTVAANVLQYGTGALNIDGCRIESDRGEQSYTVTRWKSGAELNRDGGTWKREDENAPTVSGTLPSGRWPANVLLDESQAAALDEQGGTTTSRIGTPRGADSGDGWGMTATGAEYDDSGGASRFFPTFRYEAKAPTSERPRVGDVAHPTVKPVALMRWLIRLVTPPGGTVLEPFAGSGTTAEACIAEGFRCIAIEREADYLPLIRQRLDKPIQVALDFGETV